jgi:hypothetical protein
MSAGERLRHLRGLLSQHRRDERKLEHEARGYEHQADVVRNQLGLVRLRCMDVLSEIAKTENSRENTT